MNRDEIRSAALLFPELSTGEVGLGDLQGPEVEAAIRTRRPPPFPLRVRDRLRVRGNPSHHESAWVDPRLAAREAVLGAAAPGSPRLLVRVDEFPHVRAYDEREVGTSAYARFHAILAEAGVDYLIAALPRLARRPYDPADSTERDLDPGEVAMLEELAGQGVEIAVHGLDHRTRQARPRNHSELIGLGAEELRERLGRADEILAAIGIRARVFVPPFNRFSADQYALLAERFDVVCAGPETIMEMGFQQTPQWRGSAIFLPAYAPLYGRAAEILPAVESLLERDAALWVPIVLHWSWEQEEEYASLRRLVELIGPLSRSWQELIDAGHDAAALTLGAGRDDGRGG